MKFIRTTFLLIGLVLVMFAPVSAQQWRGIVPLHSSRRDVEKLLGHAAGKFMTDYQLEKEVVSVRYLAGPCDGENHTGWKVPRDTVLEVTVSPRTLVSFADLPLDKTRLKKEIDPHVDGITYYIDKKEGISYEVSEPTGRLISISYGPKAKDEYLRCTPSVPKRERLGGAFSIAKFDEYGKIGSREEHRRLDAFARELFENPLTLAYVMSYAGRRAGVGEAKARAEQAKDYLVNSRKVDSGRIVTIDGGYREKPATALFISRLGAKPPAPSGTIDPKRVEIIRDRKR